MSLSEDEYNSLENEKTEFHKSRRMFYIHENNLVIAEEGLPYSHATWFEKEGLISNRDDKLMDEIVRGMIDSKGNVSFYIGYNFEVNKNAEDIFFSHLKELSERLNLKPNARVYGGYIKQKSIQPWPPRKDYGKLEDNLIIS
jgi:hypothetical protein